MKVRQPPSREAFLDLFVASFVALFFEAILIRWLPSSIYYLGYFKNSILIATFLGFGIGCATRLRAERVLPAFTLVCAALVLTVLLCERYLTIHPWQTGEHLWAHPGGGPVAVSMHVVLIAAYIAAAFLVIPLGRMVGLHLQAGRPLVAYSINLIASILGVLAFVALSFLRLGPEVWFAVGLLPLLYSVRRQRLAAYAIAAGVVLIVLMIRFYGSEEAYWSPYSKITLQNAPIPGIPERVLMTNNLGHQVIYDLSARRLARGPRRDHPPGSREASIEDRHWKLVEDHVAIYDSAYALHRPHSVLIVGGGTGNEAAAALRGGAQRIDMVEIDPVIIDLGARYHPERPFDDPRVRVITDDARHFMATAHERYDLIIFGFLDSTSNLSGLSNIRIDNYVYTVESVRQARALLDPGGLLQVTYYAMSPFVQARIYLMLREVFGRPPLIFKVPDGLDDYIYFAGPAIAGRATVSIPGLVQMQVLEEPSAYTLPVDDWPFINLAGRAIGRDHLIALGMMVVISAVMIGGFLGPRLSGRPARARLAVFFLLGVAFMLLETSTITRMALITGSTWVVTQSAVLLVLLASLVASQLILRYRRPTLAQGFWLLLLGAALNYAVPMGAFLSLGGLRLPASAATLYLPVLGCSIVFGRMFADSSYSDAELGVNILGAVFGGVLEYASLIIGIRHVYVIVIAILLLIGLLRTLNRDVSVTA